MTFRIRLRSESTVSITTGHNKVDGSVNIDDLLLVLGERNFDKFLFKLRTKSPNVRTLTIKASMATAQKENLVSISPHLSPKKLPSGCCNDATYLATASRSTSSKAS